MIRLEIFVSFTSQIVELKSVFLRTYLAKYSVWEGSFCKFLDHYTLSSTFLKKTDFSKSVSSELRSLKILTPFREKPVLMFPKLGVTTVKARKNEGDRLFSYLPEGPSNVRQNGSAFTVDSPKFEFMDPRGP